MKRIGAAFLTFLFYSWGLDARAVENYYYSGNVVIAANQVIDGDIYITDDTVIENNGIIRGNIIFNDAYNLDITNHNSIESNFITVAGATITQNITTQNDIHAIDNLTNYTLKVVNADGLNMADLVAMAGGASEVRVTDSLLVLGDDLSYFAAPIYFNHSNTFVINGTNLTQSCTLLSNVHGTPYMTMTDIDPMYVGTPNIVGGELKITLLRQTNYSLVFDGALGQYLDGLRDANADDKLLRKLDRVGTRRAMYDVLNESGRIKPIKLLEPMRVVNTLNDVRVFNNTDSMANIAPMYISSDEFNVIGGTLNVSGKVDDNIFARVGLFGGRMSYSGDLDEYKSWLYGANLDVAYMDKDFYVGTYTTLLYSKFSDISVFDNGKIVKNPNGVSGRFGLDTGPVFVASDEIKIAPFIGGTIDYATILNNHTTDFNARAGIEFTVNTAHDGNKYDAGMRTFIQTDGGIYAMIYSNMLSIADGIGGGVNLGALYNDSVLSYKIGLDINVLF
ncbi:MAG: hypothetical protein J5613_03075 [Alphaproteobacteria bacterium]|nr:hypothetical protein [Alphaproteobacteria bacterium]